MNQGPPPASPSDASEPQVPTVSWQQGGRGFVLAAIALAFSGASQLLISAPHSWLWLHPILFVPALLVLVELRGGRALLAGWWLGATANCTIFYWIVHTVQNFSNLPMPMAIAVLFLFGLAYGFYAAVFAWGFAAVRARCGRWWPVGIALWFTACEYLNPQLFPYYQGVVWYEWPRFFLIVALAGVPVLTFWALLCNGVVVQGILRVRQGVELRRDPAFLGNLAVLVLLTGLAFGYSHFRLGAIQAAEADAETAKFALVQTNRKVKELRRMQQKSRWAIVNDLVDLSQESEEAHPDIDVFVWPEGAMRGTPHRKYNRRARQFVREAEVELWTGGTSSRRGEDGRRESFNSAFRLDRTGRIHPKYDKNILLPFGEFMPLEETFPVLKKIQGVGNFTPGDGLDPHLTESGDFVFLICYEAIRHRYVRGGIDLGADLLVNITYDAWFGDTACPHQHLMLSAIQGALYGVPLLRGATTGISAIVDARGVITGKTGVFERTTLVGDVPRVKVPSHYQAWGDWFAQLCVVVGFGLLLLGRELMRARGWGDRFAWVGALLFVLSPPLSWGANPYMPTRDYLVWGLSVASVLVLPLLLRLPRSSAGELELDGGLSGPSHVNEPLEDER